MSPKQSINSNSLHPKLATQENSKPFVDLNQLHDYPKDSIRQIIVDLRIKKSRVSLEIVELQKLIVKARDELCILVGKRHFYQSVTVDLEKYLEETEQCQKNARTTPPAKNSAPSLESTRSN